MALRICLDPNKLNKSLKGRRYHTPMIEELTRRFADLTIFSKVDAKHGYWSIPLDDQSQFLTTVNSPFG